MNLLGDYLYERADYVAVAFDDSLVVGAALWCSGGDLGDQELLAVYVSKDRRLTGIGTRLVEFAISAMLRNGAELVGIRVASLRMRRIIKSLPWETRIQLVIMDQASETSTLSLDQ